MSLGMQVREKDRASKKDMPMAYEKDEAIRSHTCCFSVVVAFSAFLVHKNDSDAKRKHTARARPRAARICVPL